MSSNKRPVHPDKLVDKIINALLIRTVTSIRSLDTIKVLSKNLLKILMELFSALIFRKMLLVVLDKLLNLILKLLLSHLAMKVLEVCSTRA